MADVNGDGFPDIIANRNYDRLPSVYLNDGTGRFRETTLPGIPADGLYVLVSGGFQQPTRIVNVRYTWGYNSQHAMRASCVLRLQTRERPAPEAAAPNYQGLWWAATAGSESGWGINVAHQGDTIFATWFTCDTDGAPLWLSTTAAGQPDGTYSGSLYRTTGPAFDSVPFNPSAVTRSLVGRATLTFRHSNAATLAYDIGGVVQSKNIARQLFASTGTYCQ